MGEVSMDRTDSTYVEAILKNDLARGDRALRSVAPIVAHLLDISGPAIVTDALVARVRGMLTDLSMQLLHACDPERSAGAASVENVDALSDGLSRNTALLDHLHAVALEGHIAERLERQVALDPVLSPLLQELIASDQAAIAELAMKALAAQSRFMQSQRRMGLALGELPSELFLSLLVDAKATGVVAAIEGSKRSLKSLRKSYDEGVGRLGLLARLALSMRGGAVAALNLEHAGMALFTSALAMLTQQSRDLAILSCHEQQTTRLALALRAAGLEQSAIEAQFVTLGRVEAPPPDISGIASERAKEMLGQSQPVSSTTLAEELGR